MGVRMWFMWSFFVFKQKTAYEVRISDWSSDVCSSDPPHPPVGGKEWRDETPPVGVTAISVEKQEAGFPPLSPGEGFDRRSRHLARSPFGRYGERGSKPPRPFIESRTVGR